MTANAPLDEVVTGFLEKKLDLIKREYAPSMLLVFGSRARGTAAPDSDIDLMIVSERFEETRYPNRMGEFLNRIWPDVAVDAICYTPEEFERLVAKGFPFVKFALRDGIRVV